VLPTPEVDTEQGGIFGVLAVAHLPDTAKVFELGYLMDQGGIKLN
jgi:hypothetical protein